MEPEGRLGEASFVDGEATAVVGGQKDLAGSRSARDILLLHTLVLQLPAKIQICFCFLVEERLPWKDLEEDPFSVEFPFI